MFPKIDDSSNNFVIETSLTEFIVDGCEIVPYLWEFTKRETIEITAPNLLSLTLGGFTNLNAFELVDVSSLHSSGSKDGLVMKTNSFKSEPFVDNKTMIKNIYLKLHHVDKLTVGAWCFHVSFLCLAFHFEIEIFVWMQ